VNCYLLSVYLFIHIPYSTYGRLVLSDLSYICYAFLCL